MGEDLLKANPCSKIKGNELDNRERVLAASEVPLFWEAFGKTEDPMRGFALKVLLLTGQRPGEVTHLRREHMVDGWWKSPGRPVAALGSPGTKNGENHRDMAASCGAGIDCPFGPGSDNGFRIPRQSRADPWAHQRHNAGDLLNPWSVGKGHTARPAAHTRQHNHCARVRSGRHEFAFKTTWKAASQMSTININTKGRQTDR